MTTPAHDELPTRCHHGRWADPVGDELRACVAMALFSFLFLFIFEPFELSRLSVGHRLVLSAANATIQFVVSYGAVALYQRFFPASWVSDRRHDVAELVFVVVLLISIAAALTVTFLIFFQPTSSRLSIERVLRVYGTIQLRVLLIGVFPLIGLFIYQRREITQQRVAELQELVERLAESQDQPGVEVAESPRVIEVPAENSRESVSLSAPELLCVASANNYVEIFSQTKQGLERKLLRNKLKTVETHLSTAGVAVFRSHRTHLVHLPQIQSIKHTPSGYRLMLRGSSHSVPLARRRRAELRRLLADTESQKLPTDR